MQYQIVLDVGGTGIKGALYNGKTLTDSVHEFPAHSDADRDTLIRHFCFICKELLVLSGNEGAVCSAISAAFPGPFDYVRGIPFMRGLAKYEDLYGVPLPEAMLECWHIMGITAFDHTAWHFLNDVSAFALGAVQKHHMSGRTMCVCLGTGAGSAFLIGSSLCTDITEGVPENGWIYPLPFEGNIIDDVLSARGITKIASRYCHHDFTPLQLSNKAYSGDSSAVAAWREFGSLLTRALIPISEQFCADALVIGGKIVRSSNLFLDELQNACAKIGICLITETETSALTIQGLLI